MGSGISCGPFKHSAVLEIRTSDDGLRQLWKPAGSSPRRACRSHEDTGRRGGRGLPVSVFALDNAEAVDLAHAPAPSAGHADLAGTVAGLGATEFERGSLTEAQRKWSSARR